MKLVPEPRWKTVYQTKNELSIRILKMTLESEGIPVMIFDQRDSSYNSFGDMYLQVPVELEKEVFGILESKGYIPYE